MGRVKRAWLVVLVALGGAAVLGAAPAFAVTPDPSCSVWERVVGGNSSTGRLAPPGSPDWIIRYGSQITATVHVRDTNQTCGGFAHYNYVVGTWAKVRFVDGNGNLTPYYVEAGYEQDILYQSPDKFTVDFRYHVPSEDNDYYMGYAAATTIGFIPGNTCSFRVEPNLTSGSTTYWIGKITCGDGIWHTIAPSPHSTIGAPYDRGLSLGMTERWGGEKTGMKDTITNPKSAGSSGVWSLWSNIACYGNSSSNWAFGVNSSQVSDGWDVYLSPSFSGC